MDSCEQAGFLAIAGHTTAKFLTSQIRASELLIFPQASSADLQAY
jgi:hypothetical protein